MPERVGLDAVVGAGGEADARQRAVDPLVRASRPRAAAWTCRFSRPVRCGWKRGSSMIAPTRASAAARSPRQVVPEQAHAAGGRLGEAEQQPDQRGLAGAVGAEEAEGDAARHLEVDAVERRPRAEPLAEAAGLDGEVGGGGGGHAAKLRARDRRVVGRQDEPPPPPHPIG